MSNLSREGDASWSENSNFEWSNKTCFCGLRAPIWTSWTLDNPSRRFIGCPNYKDSSSNCKFFRWVDPELNEGSKRVILANRLRVLKEENIRLSNEAQILAQELKQRCDKLEGLKEKIRALKIDKFHLQLDVNKHTQKEKLLSIIIVVLCIVILALLIGEMKSFSNPMLARLV